MPNQGTIINNVRAYSLANVPLLRAGASGELVVCQGSMVSCDPVTGAPGSSLLCAGVEVETALSPVLNLSATQTILFKLRSLLTDGEGALQVRPFLRNATAGTKAYLPIANLNNQGVTAHVCDLTMTDPVLTANITHVGFSFASDCIQSGAVQFPLLQSGTLPIFACYAVTRPGNIAAGTTLSYKTSEWDASRDVKLFNVIQSDGSPLSAGVTTDAANGAATVTVLPKTNTAATYIAVYRFGDFPDGYGRLLCLLPITGADFAAGTDTAKGTAPYYAARANPYIAVLHAPIPTATGTLVITDNTPASFLLEAALYQGGREKPPNYIREIVSWQNRIWVLANGQTDNRRRSELYGSWLLSADNNAGLYFSRVVSPSDPSAPVKGFYSHLGTEDGDKAQRLLTIEDRLVALFERKAPYLILGSDPSNVEIRPFKGEANAVLGLVARRAAILSGYNVIYLTANGLVSWSPLARVYGPPPAPIAISEIVRNLVAPHTGYMPAFATSAVAQACLWEHGGRYFLTMPGAPGDANPTRILRLDLSNQGSNNDKEVSTWTRYLCAFAPATGADVPGSDNNAGHYVAGRDGMMYLAAIAAGDTSVAGGAVSPIAFSLVTRAYGSDSGALFALKRPFRLDIDLENGDTAASVMLLIGMTGQTTSWGQNYLLGAAARDQFTARPGFVRGENVTVTLSGSAANRVTIGAVRVLLSVGSERSKLL